MSAAPLDTLKLSRQLRERAHFDPRRTPSKKQSRNRPNLLEVRGLARRLAGSRSCWTQSTFSLRRQDSNQVDRILDKQRAVGIILKIEG